MLNKINKKIITSTLGILAFSLLSGFIAIPRNAQADFNGYYHTYAGYSPVETYNTTNGRTLAPTPTYIDPITENNNDYSNERPVIYSITPNEVLSGSRTITISITGKNFAPGSTARLNSYDRQTNYYDRSHLGMIVPASDLREHGTFYVTVFNPSNGLISDSYPLTVNRSVPPATTIKTVTKSASTASTAKKTSTTTKKTSDDNTNTAVDAEKDSNDNGLSANALFGVNGFLPATFLQWLILAILVLIIIILFRKAYLSEEDKSPHNLKHA